MDLQGGPAAFGTGPGYGSLVPIRGELRVDVFSHRPLDDPWTRRIRASPLCAPAEPAPQAARRP